MLTATGILAFVGDSMTRSLNVNQWNRSLMKWPNAVLELTLGTISWFRQIILRCDISTGRNKILERTKKEK